MLQEIYILLMKLIFVFSKNLILNSQAFKGVAVRKKHEDCTSNKFQPVIDDDVAADSPEQVERILRCSGKVYYDLVGEREKRFADSQGRVAVLRVEELYPWPQEELSALIGRYGGASRVYWVQEEPANMGPWTFVRERIQNLILPDMKLAYAGRVPSASPAVGSLRLHRKEQQALLDAAFEGLA